MAQSKPSVSLLSLLQIMVLLVIALIMIGIGHSFSDDCNNGATDFLVIGGWISFALSILTAIVSGPMKEESCVLGLYTYTAHTHILVPLVTFVGLIWVAPMIILLWTF